jgi:hypothetical protein
MQRVVRYSFALQSLRNNFMPGHLSYGFWQIFKDKNLLILVGKCVGASRYSSSIWHQRVIWTPWGTVYVRSYKQNKTIKYLCNYPALHGLDPPPPTPQPTNTTPAPNKPKSPPKKSRKKSKKISKNTYKKIFPKKIAKKM